MKSSLLLLAALWLPHMGHPQNLIPNGDLSEHTFNRCPFPFEGIAGLATWYAIGATTVDYYLPECRYAPQPGAQILPAFHYNLQESFLGFWGLVKRDFTMVSEAFATPLSEPLQAGRTYAFMVDLRHRGKFHPIERVSPRYCPTTPPMSLCVYANRGPIGATLDRNKAATKIFARQVLSFDVFAVIDTSVSDRWTPFMGCFVAEGGEDQMAWSMTIDSFPPVPPCDQPYDPTAMDQWISVQYFNADNFSLVPFPMEVRDTLLMCEDHSEVSLDVTPHFGNVGLAALQPVWSDGVQGTRRTFSQPGVYEYTLDYTCGSTPVIITVLETRCSTLPFVANAFSPNADGINDRFSPSFSADFPVGDYLFTVFDRWGKVVYTSRVYDPTAGWDGTTRSGQAAPGGVYVWKLSFVLMAPDRPTPYDMSGSVVLLR
ncbi:MAG: hypothetical protein OHK0039_34030 [Bacteroidia bacterium]